MSLGRGPRDPRRTLILKLRRAVKVSSTFDIAPDPDDPLTEIQTCRECGYVERLTHKTTLGMAKKLISYRAQPGGVRGTCPKCSQQSAKERYPLPEDKKT